MIGQKYQLYKQQLDNALARLSEFPVTPSVYLDEEFKKVIHEFEKFARSTEFIELENVIIESELFQKKFSLLRKIYNDYEVFLETKQAIESLRDSNALVDKEFVHFETFVKKEVAISNITNKSVVYFVGSGPYPESALAISYIAQCKIICIDSNPVAVTLANELTTNKNIQSYVNYGQSIDYKNATHIFIAALATNKKEILKQICATTKTPVCVIVRMCTGIRSIIYEKTPDLLLEHFEFIDTVKGDAIMESVILRHSPHHN